MTSAGQAERRRAPRVPAEDSRLAMGAESQVLDVSETGLRVQLSFRPTLGSTLAFQLVLDGEAQTLQAVVRYVLPLADVGLAYFCIVGLEFKELDEPARAFLAGFVRKQLGA